MNVNVQEGANYYQQPRTTSIPGGKSYTDSCRQYPRHSGSNHIVGMCRMLPHAATFYPDDSKDANPNPETAGADKDEYWLTTGVDYPF